MDLKRRPNSLLNYNPTCHYDAPEEKSFIDDYKAAEITRTFSYGKIISDSVPEEDDFEQIRSKSFGGVMLRENSKQYNPDMYPKDQYSRNLKSNPTTPVGNNSFSSRALRSLQSGLGSISSSVMKRFSFHGVSTEKLPPYTDSDPNKIQSTAYKGWNLLSSPTSLHSKNFNTIEGESLLDEDISDYPKEKLKHAPSNLYKDGTDNSNFGWATDANWNLSPMEEHQKNPFNISNSSSSWEPTDSMNQDPTAYLDKRQSDVSPICEQSVNNPPSQSNSSDKPTVLKQRKRGSGFLKWFSKDKEGESHIPSNYGLLSCTDDDPEMDADYDSCEEEEHGSRLW